MLMLSQASESPPTRSRTPKFSVICVLRYSLRIRPCSRCVVGVQRWVCSTIQHPLLTACHVTRLHQRVFGKLLWCASGVPLICPSTICQASTGAEEILPWNRILSSSYFGLVSGFHRWPGWPLVRPELVSDRRTGVGDACLLFSR